MAITFSLPAAAGAYAGTLAGNEVSPRALILAFVPVMLFAAVLTYHRGDGASDRNDEAGGCPEPPLLATGSCGVGVGLLTGFFGVGGGFLIVPALTILLGLSLRRAIATSLAIITLTGLAALVSHLVEGAEPNWGLTLTLCAAAAAGALAGTSLGRRLEVATLAHAFSFVVAVVALFLLVDVLLLGGPPVG